LKEYQSKAAPIMLVILTTGVNFNNILCLIFCFEFFSLVPLCNFYPNNFNAKAARKMLVKLTTG